MRRSNSRGNDVEDPGADCLLYRHEVNRGRRIEKESGDFVIVRDADAVFGSRYVAGAGDEGLEEVLGKSASS